MSLVGRSGRRLEYGIVNHAVAENNPAQAGGMRAKANGIGSHKISGIRFLEVLTRDQRGFSPKSARSDYDKGNLPVSSEMSQECPA